MKEENVKSEYQRKVDKSLIPTCNIMGVNIAAINILLQKRLRDLQIMLLKILLRKKERLQSVLIPVSNPMYLPK